MHMIIEFEMPVKDEMDPQEALEDMRDNVISVFRRTMDDPTIPLVEKQVFAVNCVRAIGVGIKSVDWYVIEEDKLH